MSKFSRLAIYLDDIHTIYLHTGAQDTQYVLCSSQNEKYFLSANHITCLTTPDNAISELYLNQINF